MNYLCKAIAFVGLDYCQEQAVSKHVEALFQEHIASFGKSYGTKEEYEYRLGLFAAKHGELA